MVCESHLLTGKICPRKPGAESVRAAARTGVAFILMSTRLHSRFNLRLGLAAIVLLSLSACKLPEQRQAFYANGFLKERYWVYRDSGREVMNGLYTGWFPNGEREVEILYRDGSEVMKTYFSDRGSVLGSIDLASLREP